MKKFLPYILIIVFVLIGLFSPTTKIYAQTEAPGVCTIPPFVTPDACTQAGGVWQPFITCELPDGTEIQTTTADCAAQNGSQIYQSTTESRSDFEKEISKNKCSTNPFSSGTFWPGCFIQASYAIFYAIPTFLLWFSAYFFNVLIKITLYSKLFAGSTFIPEAWAVVRDLSNIFFILILLYIAIKIILDIGGAEAKKMIARVVVVALLINFSMFFTEVIIDSSNMLALIFYNKIDVQARNPNGTPRPYDDVIGDKDIAGGMVQSFDPTRLLTQEFFEKAKVQQVPGLPPTKSKQVPPGILIGVTILAGTVMLFAAYCLLWAGVAFLVRMIELFILIIFSPFAFMSSTVPKLANIEYLGWEPWFKRLLKTAFMAPIFMFFLYFIFMLIGKKIFDGFVSPTNTSMIATILLLVIPAAIVLTLLLKATEFAKKGSGKLGEVLMTGAKMVGGVALGAATGGAALLATKTIGATAAEQLASKGEVWREQANKGGFGGLVARMKLKTTDLGSKASFDLGKAPGVGSLTKRAGLDLSSAKILGLGPKEGGFRGAGERHAKVLEEESKLYKTKMTDTQTEAWSKREQDKYDVKKEEAKNAVGGKSLDIDPAKAKAFEEDYVRKNGPRPDWYKTAEGLNNHRMNEFISNFGKTGLTGAVAFEIVKKRDKLVDDKGDPLLNKKHYQNSKEYLAWKKERDEAEKQAMKKEGDYFKKPRFDEIYKAEHPEPTAKSINDGRVQNTKLVVGGTAAAVAGLMTGGVAAGAMGAGAGAMGGGAAGVYKATPVGSEKAGEAIFSKKTDKEFAQMSRITDIMEQNKKTLEGLHDLLETAVKNGKISGSKENGFATTDGLEKELIELQNIARREELRLRRIEQQGRIDENGEYDEETKNKMRAVEVTIGKNNFEIFKLNELRAAVAKEKQLRIENHRLNKDKSSLEEKREKAATDGKPKTEKEKRERASGAGARSPKTEEKPQGAPATHPTVSSPPSGKYGGPVNP